MDTETVDTIIVGGGLSGIYAASLLTERKRSLVLLEARPRLGGRIISPEHQGFFADLGPSWYWPMVNPKLSGLTSTWDNRLHLAGSETDHLGGYLEGALSSAGRAASIIQ